ncbi:MAG TPA: type IV pilus modification protein PilV [Noviherbaspirillum sp.]|uniref:type IV pilus modification protein PilV n=1 Tax=Noviherbaspirillum sp. TaxID=1926288 RepID=UPI002D26A752|nr:type IV pilus modification protein PilV [Noviherbaspirillum sp.]HYD96814.1 type IV pilus modification protein PilV [Noviherbaspirillum sp.]
MSASNLQRQHGTSMIEVLVTIVILTIGLMGLIGLQARMQLSEMESYQRAQALILLEDMANRITNNRSNAASYVTSTPLGTGNTCTASSASSLQVRDSCEWNDALQGAAEMSGSNRVGTLIGGRGCVDSLGNGEYMVTVAWQGLTPVSAPPSSVACGQNLYNGSANSTCTNDRCRRTLTTIVRIATLTTS